MKALVIALFLTSNFSQASKAPLPKPQEARLYYFEIPPRFYRHCFWKQNWGADQNEKFDDSQRLNSFPRWCLLSNS